MRIVIIGSGNVATVLGKKISVSGHTIVQVFSRDPFKAADLVTTTGATIVSEPGLLDHTADIYIIAVSDAAVPEISGWLNLNDKIVMHTAGSVSINVLNKCSSSYGVLYPLQSIRKESVHVPAIPILVDGNNQATKSAIRNFASSFSDQVAEADDLQRSNLHLAAVVVNNFSNHLYKLASDFCKAENVDFNMLRPLITETVARLETSHPAEVQTGPAMRKDYPTIGKHEELLSNHPELLGLYKLFTSQIMKSYFFFFFFLFSLMSTS